MGVIPAYVKIGICVEIRIWVISKYQHHGYHQDQRTSTDQVQYPWCTSKLDCCASSAWLSLCMFPIVDLPWSLLFFFQFMLEFMQAYITHLPSIDMPELQVIQRKSWLECIELWVHICMLFKNPFSYFSVCVLYYFCRCADLLISVY